MATENQVLEVVAPISDHPDLGAPRQARFTDLSINANGGLYASYTVDILSLDKSKVVIQGNDSGRLEFNPFGEEEQSDEVKAIFTALRPKLKTLFNTIETEEAE